MDNVTYFMIGLHVIQCQLLCIVFVLSRIYYELKRGDNMSLDVYLTLESNTTENSGSGIFVREDGETREISRQEWDEEADIDLVILGYSVDRYTAMKLLWKWRKLANGAYSDVMETTAGDQTKYN